MVGYELGVLKQWLKSNTTESPLGCQDRLITLQLIKLFIFLVTLNYHWNGTSLVKFWNPIPVDRDSFIMLLKYIGPWLCFHSYGDFFE